MYKIVLPNFEGPFDLLLYLIKKEELNLYDIPIAKITEEFLNYVRLMQIFDLDLAGEFLVMASSLIYMKIKLLLPHDTRNPETEEDDDPVNELTRRILDYKRIKYAAADLGKLAENQRYTYYRQLFEAEQVQVENQLGITYKNSSLFDLLSAFKKVLDKQTNVEKNYEISFVNYSIEETTNYIINYLNIRKRVSFAELCIGSTISHIVINFLAILDLIRKRLVFILQSNTFDEITIAVMPENMAIAEN